MGDAKGKFRPRYFDDLQAGIPQISCRRFHGPDCRPLLASQIFSAAQQNYLCSAWWRSGETLIGRPLFPSSPRHRFPGFPHQTAEVYKVKRARKVLRPQKKRRMGSRQHGAVSFSPRGRMSRGLWTTGLVWMWPRCLVSPIRRDLDPWRRSWHIALPTKAGSPHAPAVIPVQLASWEG